MVSAGLGEFITFKHGGSILRSLQLGQSGRRGPLVVFLDSQEPDGHYRSIIHFPPFYSRFSLNILPELAASGGDVCSRNPRLPPSPCSRSRTSQLNPPPPPPPSNTSTSPPPLQPPIAAQARDHKRTGEPGTRRERQGKSYRSRQQDNILHLMAGRGYIAGGLPCRFGGESDTTEWPYAIR